MLHYQSDPTEKVERLHRFFNKFLDVLSRHQLDAETIMCTLKHVADGWKSEHGDAEATVRRLSKNLEDLKQQKHRLLTAYLNGAVKQADYQDANEVFDRQITDIQREIASTQFERSAIDDVLEFSKKVLSDLPKAWISATGATKEKFQTLLFPDGLEYYPQDGFLKSCISPVISQLSAAGNQIYQFGVPDGI